MLRAPQALWWLELSVDGAMVRMMVERWQQGLVVKDLEGHAKDLDGIS